MAVTKPAFGLGKGNYRVPPLAPQENLSSNLGQTRQNPSSKRGPGKGVPAGVRPYERVAGAWQAQLQACFYGSRLTKTARHLILAWAGKEAEAGRPRRFTPPQAARLVDCHRRTAERAMGALVREGWIRLVTSGSRADRLASDYELVRERLPRFGDRICRKRTSEAEHRRQADSSALSKSAANRRSPGSLRTIKISTQLDISPMASKRPRGAETHPMPAGQETMTPEKAVAIEAVASDLRSEGFAEVQLKHLANEITNGKRDIHQVQALLDACRYRWRHKEPYGSRAKFFAHALRDPAMTQDLLRALPKSGIFATPRPTVRESTQLARVSPTLRAQPRFMDHYLKWQRLLAVEPHGDSPGFLDWFDHAQELQKVVVQHAERALGPRVTDLQRLVKARLQEEPGAVKENSILWSHLFKKRYVSLILGECGLQ